MAATSLQDQIDFLVSKKVAEEKIKGAPAPDIEAPAVFESIALNLLMAPRTVLFAATMARNATLATASRELKVISDLRQSVLDTANKTFAVRNTTSLDNAVTALLQLENLDKVNTESEQYQTFSRSIDEFLNKQLAKNVKRRGSPTMARPSEEASKDAVTGFETLDGYHTEFLDKFYALNTGVDNFLSSPISTTIGLSTAYRVRQDIQDIIEAVENDPSGSDSRSFANRLIASRAVLRVVGAPPDIFGPVIDTALSKPDGYVLKATSEEAPALFDSAGPGPFVLSGNGPMTIQVNNSVVSNFASDLFQTMNAPAIYTLLAEDGVTFPLTIQPQHHLFLKFEALPSVTGWTGPDADGSYTHGTLGPQWFIDDLGVYWRVFKVSLNDTASPVVVNTMTDLLNLLNTSLDVLATAEEYLYTGSNRLIISANSTYLRSILVSPSVTEPEPNSTVAVNRYYTLSDHAALGFRLGQLGVMDESISIERVLEAIDYFYSSVVTAVRNSPTTFQLRSVDVYPGTTASISGALATDLGLSVTQPSTDTFSLSGKIFGVSTNTTPFDHAGLISVGDSVLLPGGSSSLVTAVTIDSVTVADQFQTFSGQDISVSSALIPVWQAIESKMAEQVPLVSRSAFSENVKKIGDAIQALSNDPTQARRNTALQLLDSLSSLLNGVVASLSDPTTVLPARSATNERANARSIITALEERKFDKAADYFSICKVSELLGMTYQTGSYAGSLMQAAEELAQSDVKFVDRTADEGSNTFYAPDRRST